MDIKSSSDVRQNEFGSLDQFVLKLSLSKMLFCVILCFFLSFGVNGFKQAVPSLTQTPAGRLISLYL